MAKDPVCGMEVNPESAAGSAKFEGVTYYFCSQNCEESFLTAPERYVGGGTAKGSGKGLLGRLFRRS